MILRPRLLAQIGRYLPDRGIVLDIGCGFGLFALYFAKTHPHLELHGFDLNARRIECAQRAARKLGLANAHFRVADASTFTWDEPIRGAYLLDLIHHIPEQATEPLLRQVANNLAVGERLVIKDIRPTPFLKMAFTWLLDKAMDFRAPVKYWPPAKLVALIESLGFSVEQRFLNDLLPYPHVLYVGTKYE